MATKNTRNAALMISQTLGGTYTKVNKTHGLNFNLPTDFSEDTSHGDFFKSYLPGLQDAGLTIAAWYDTIATTLEALSYKKLSYYFLLYIDLADTQNYYRGQMFFGLDGLNLDLGNTADLSYTGRIANGDAQIVRNGAVLT